MFLTCDLANKDISNLKKKKNERRPPTLYTLVDPGHLCVPSGFSVTLWHKKKSFFCPLQMQFASLMDPFLCNFTDIELLAINVFHVLCLYLTTDQYFCLKIGK